MIEWDKEKRDWTLRHRGLDFADVALVEWDQAVTSVDTRKDYGEVRFHTLAPIQDRLCAFAWCQRGDRIRVISLRKANQREVQSYGRNKAPLLQ